jgi:hypothetical protein
MQTAHDGEEKKPNKMCVVAVTDTVIEVNTVMVLDGNGFD